MSRASTLGSVLPAAICILLSVVYLLEWRSSRSVIVAASQRSAHAMLSLERTLTVKEDRTRAAIAGVRTSIDSLANELRRRQALVSTLESEQQDEWQDVSEEEAEERAPQEDLTDLPVVPDRVNAESLVREMKLGEFFGDPRFNPDGHELDKLEQQRAINIVDRAQARIRTLNSDVQLTILERMRELAEEGLYIDYAPGERRETVPGVITSAESDGRGGIRMYYLYPEEHPDVYEMKREIKEVSETAVRKLMDLALRAGASERR